MSGVRGARVAENGTASSTILVARAGLFLLFLVCSLVVFLLGPKHYEMFPTNGSSVYAGGFSALFLIAALSFKRSERFRRYWQIAYAFFVASAVNFFLALFGGYSSAFLQYLGASTSTNQGLALDKVYEAVLVVIPILLLTKLSGADLSSLFLKRGTLNRPWGLGIGALVLLNFSTSALIFFGTGYSPAGLGSAIVWGTLFSASNGLLEELWIRGLFLKRLVPLIGSTGTVLLTSTYFASLHFLSVAYLPAAVVPIFVANTFTLGLACGILTLKADSLLGAFLIHAAADLFLFIATLAIR